MNTPENKATPVATEKQAGKTIAKPVKAHAPVSLNVFAETPGEIAAKANSSRLAAPVRVRAAFNDADSVRTRRLDGTGTYEMTQLRRAPNGQRFLVIPEGSSAEIRTDLAIEAPEFEWRALPPAIDGIIAVDVATQSGRVYVDVRSFGGGSATVFERDVIAELY